jgi:hypothetical protein
VQVPTTLAAIRRADAQNLILHGYYLACTNLNVAARLVAARRPGPGSPREQGTHVSASADPGFTFGRDAQLTD